METFYAWWLWLFAQVLTLREDGRHVLDCAEDLHKMDKRKLARVLAALCAIVYLWTWMTASTAGCGGGGCGCGCRGRH
jgi:hypothetical protein